MARKGTVYSTDKGKHCPQCGEPERQCNCKRQESPVAGDGIVRLQRQTKGRNGKPVTLIIGIPLRGTELKALAKELKNKCGTGGSIEDDVILIQGDKREKLKQILEAKNYTVKLSGG